MTSHKKISATNRGSRCSRVYGDSRFDDGLGYRFTVTARTPSLVTALRDWFVITRLRASTALAVGCKKFALQTLWESALYMPQLPDGRFGMYVHFFDAL